MRLEMNGDNARAVYDLLERIDQEINNPPLMSRDLPEDKKREMAVCTIPPDELYKYIINIAHTRY